MPFRNMKSWVMCIVLHSFCHADIQFWKESYKIADTPPLAPFISDLIQQVFICGKTVNLMRLTAPNVSTNSSQCEQE